MSKKWLFGMMALPLLLVFGAVFFFVMMFSIIMTGGQSEESPASVFNPSEISQLGAEQIPPEYIIVYQEAAEAYGIPWNLLASIHRIETRFSTIDPMVSYVGAEGHFQFMPCTWVGWGHPTCGGLGTGNIPQSERIDPLTISRYGGFGVDANSDGKADPYDIEDAAHTAANYLARSGAAKGQIREAIFAYNRSDQYVAEVMEYMNKYAEQPKAVIPPIAGTGGFIHPSNAPVNSGFGNRVHPITGIVKLHQGLDFDCSTGDPIVASKAGVVTHAGWFDASRPKAGWGLFVWVEHSGGLKTGYAHLSSMSVGLGDTVNPGDVVGACGTTGASTGDHLHFEVFKNGTQVDPAPYLGM